MEENFHIVMCGERCQDHVCMQDFRTDFDRMSVTKSWIGHYVLDFWTLEHHLSPVVGIHDQGITL